MAVGRVGPNVICGGQHGDGICNIRCQIIEDLAIKVFENAVGRWNLILVFNSQTRPATFKDDFAILNCALVRLEFVPRNPVCAKRAQDIGGAVQKETEVIGLEGVKEVRSDWRKVLDS